VSYATKSALSRITLRWIVREADKLSSIVWDEAVLIKFRVRKPKPTTATEAVTVTVVANGNGESSSSNAAAANGSTPADYTLDAYIEQERLDALSEAHSAFKWNNLWWVLEVLPLFKNVQLWGKWRTVLWPNWFSPRHIRLPTERHKTKVHSSVKTRLTSLKTKNFWGKEVPYKNLAQWDPKLVEFVDEWAVSENMVH